MVDAYFSVLSWHSPGETKEKQTFLYLIACSRLVESPIGHHTNTSPERYAYHNGGVETIFAGSVYWPVSGAYERFSSS